MNNVARNLNEHCKQHRTLYAEERNVANKEKVEDRLGLRNAHWSLSALYKADTLYFRHWWGQFEKRCLWTLDVRGSRFESALG